MQPIKTIIVEDEHKPREALKLKIEKHYNGIIEIKALCVNAEQAYAAVLMHQPQLILLDITMPGTSGLEMLEQIRMAGNNSKVIITSSHHQTDFFRKAMHLSTVDYLLKPVMLEELNTAISKVLEKIESEQAAQEIKSTGTAVHKKLPYEFSCAVGKIFLKEEQIVYIRADGNYSRVFMVNGNSEMITESMKLLETKLAGSLIERVDRSHFINRSFVQKVVTSSNRCYFMPELNTEPIVLNETGIRNLLRSGE
jgi:two-component system, LytTR family, response regulator